MLFIVLHSKLGANGHLKSLSVYPISCLICAYFHSASPSAAISYFTASLPLNQPPSIHTETPYFKTKIRSLSSKYFSEINFTLWHFSIFPSLNSMVYIQNWPFFIPEALPPPLVSILILNQARETGWH